MAAPKLKTARYAPIPGLRLQEGTYNSRLVPNKDVFYFILTLRTHMGFVRIYFVRRNLRTHTYYILYSTICVPVNGVLKFVEIFSSNLDLALLLVTER